MLTSHVIVPRSYFTPLLAPRPGTLQPTLHSHHTSHLPLDHRAYSSCNRALLSLTPYVMGRSRARILNLPDVLSCLVYPNYRIIVADCSQLAALHLLLTHENVNPGFLTSTLANSESMVTYSGP